MIELPLAITVGIAIGFALVAVLLGTALVRVSRKKRSSVDGCSGESAWIAMPPLITTGPGCDFAQSKVQPQSLLEVLGIRKPKGQVIIDEELKGDGGDNMGKLNFGITYDKQSQTLAVHLFQATDLPVMDLTGSSDPYVRAFLLPDDGSRKPQVSRVHHRTLNPQFNQTLYFGGHSMKKLEEMSLCLQAMDYDRFTRDDPIGEILLPMKHVKFENSPVYWKALQKPTIRKETKSELMLSLCFLPQSNRMTVVVIKGKDLPPKDISGSSGTNPYVKLWLVDQGNKTDKKKTTVKHQTLNPVFNESFSFNVNGETLREMSLVVSAMDYDLLSSNDEMGHVMLGPNGSETGRKHWNEMLNRPGYPVAMWHKLTPKW